MNENLATDTRSTAAKYISEKIPAGSTIGLLGREDELWRFPKIDSDLSVIKAVDQPDYLVTSSFDYSAEGTLEEENLSSVFKERVLRNGG